MKYWLAILQKSEIFCGLEGQGSQWAVTMNWEDLKFSVWSWTRPLASLMFGTLCAWKIHLRDWRLTPPPRYGQHCRFNICSYIETAVLPRLSLKKCYPTIYLCKWHSLGKTSIFTSNHSCGKTVVQSAIGNPTAKWEANGWHSLGKHVCQTEKIQRKRWIIQTT